MAHKGRAEMSHAGRAETEWVELETERKLRFGLEAGPGYGAGLREIRRYLNAFTVVTGIFPVFIICLSVAAVFAALSAEAGLSRAQAESWMSSMYIFGGVNSLILATYYKKPLVGAFSIPGLVVAFEALNGVPYSEAVGAFIVGGLIVLVLGLTGVVNLVVRWIPSPIMSSMIAGVLLSFPLRIVEAFELQWSIALAAVLGYVVVHRWVPRTPGVVGAIAAGLGAAVLVGALKPVAISFDLALPAFQPPGLSVAAVVSIALPLAILTIGAENMQAIGVLRSLRMRPPVTAITLLSGVATAVAGVFGGHSANVAGPTTAMCASPDAGPVRGRYVAAIVAGFTFIAFGLLAPVMLQAVDILPAAFTAVLVGLVLLPVVAATLADGWRSSTCTVGAMVAFLVALAGVTIWGVSAAFWAIVFGCLTSLALETQDYRRHVRQG